MTHSGLLFDEQDPATSKKTLDTINDMMTDLGNWDNKLTLEEELALSWHKDMIWWGPTGIGSSYTIERWVRIQFTSSHILGPMTQCRSYNTC